VADDPDPISSTVTKLHESPEGLIKVQEENEHEVNGKVKN
jgi:hypothetical protein